VQTDILDISRQPYENLLLQLPVIDHQPDDMVIIALGIEFVHVIRGAIQRVDKMHNALAVVKVFLL
jgi:hypothetical protein